MDQRGQKYSTAKPGHHELEAMEYWCSARHGNRPPPLSQSACRAFADKLKPLASHLLWMLTIIYAFSVSVFLRWLCEGACLWIIYFTLPNGFMTCLLKMQ